MSTSINERPDIRKIEGDKILAYLYLYIPVFIFLLSWIKPFLAYPICILFTYYAVKGIRNKSVAKIDGFGLENLRWLLAFAALMFLWCVLSGQGALVAQAGDWDKHNALLLDLIQNDWPVRYEYHNRIGILSYYIGAYLVPAVFGKIGGAEIAEWVMLLWTWAGLILVGIRCWKYIDSYSGWKLVAVGLGMILFSTFASQMSEIYGNLLPEDVGDGFHWMSSSIRIQYSSNIILLRWVFPQTVASWLVCIMILEKQNDIQSWGVICAPLMLYSTFAFVGLCFLLLLLLAFKMIRGGKKVWKNTVKSIFSSQNMAALLLLCVLAAYFAGNILQTKPGTANMSLQLLDYSNYKKLFVLFQLSWGIWILLIIRREHRNAILYAIVISLFLFPFFSLGKFNDLCMRGSIPALFLLCVLVIKNILDKRNQKIYRVLLICALLISSTGSRKEITDAVSSNGIHKGNRRVSYSSLTELMDRYEFTAYQYVDWNAEKGINHWIVR